MLSSLGMGILLVVIGGFMEGTYAVAMKYTPGWKWEHIWGAASLASLLIVGWPVALLSVPGLGQVFAVVGLRGLVVPALFGLGWGAGSIFFGLGVDAVGIAVGVSVIMGLIAVIGSVFPLLLYHPEKFGEPSGQLMVAALAVMVVGIVLCGVSGYLREKALTGVTLAAAASGSTGVRAAQEVNPARRPSFRMGLIFCVLSGVLSPLANFALIKGDNLRAVAMQHGASALWAINAVWMVVLTVGYGLSVLYCVYLMVRRRNFADLGHAHTGKYWLLAGIMGALWAGGIVLYGLGVAYMGRFGAYAGWPLLLIAAISASNVSGVIIGEWKGTGGKPLAVMGAALGVLSIAAVILGFANRMMAT